MRTRTLFLYLICNSQAILEIARGRRPLGLGLLFVLSAGLARDYDGEDLLHEPWHLGLAVSPSYPNRSITLFAGASLLIWLLILPLTQGEQFLRHRVEQIYKAGDIPGFLTDPKDPPSSRK
jgi:hypothetical protein